ncbi:hypothetical protein [Leifsonia sp. Root4]|uniref:hypothetical protein n=1 Tax=Leifsonia sp. Root4 TaxID=1736525 RepID=UPI0012F72001|nr:hypothetical protein [Leifsonia sp. Root4]
MRAHDFFAVVHGEWFEWEAVSGSGGAMRLLPSSAQIAALPWVAESVDDRGHLDVSHDEIERSLYVKPQCTFRGGGPFEVSGIKDADGAWVRHAVSAGSPGYRALIRYVGEDWAWAEQLEGFEVYDVYSAMGDCVQAWVPLSQISDYREIVEERPIPGRG